MNFFWHDSKNLSSFFFENNSKNWLFSKIWFKELNLFLSMIQRIESLSEYDSKESNSLFFEYDSMNRSHFFECDSIKFWVEKSKNWFFSSKLNFSSHDSKNWTSFCFWIWTQRIEPFIIWLEELSLFLTWRNALNFFPVFRKEFIESHRKTRKVQFFESYFLIKCFNSLRHMKEKGVHFFASYSKKRVQFFASYWKKKGATLCVFEKKKDWNLWLTFKNSILWVILRKHPFFDSY